MKKKLLSSILCVLLLGLLCACGKQEEKDVDALMQELDPYEYVTLGDYQNLTTEVQYYNYTEEDVQMCVESEVGFYVDYYGLYDYEIDVSANAVENGSVVNIDYVGTIDGVAFDGGTAQDQHLMIGSNSYIPGFEDGLINSQVGDTVELHLTFPEGYNNPAYAGKDAVFTVSVNAIERQVMPEFTDELIASLNLGAEITSYDSYLNYIHDYLEKSCNDENEVMLQTSLWDAAYSVCQISDPPEFLVDYYKEDLESYFTMYASYYNMDLETFVSTQMGMTMEEFDQRNQESAIDEAKMELAYRAIAKAEGIEVDDDVMQQVAEEEYALYGYASANDFINTMGKLNFRSYVLRNRVIDRLGEEITVIELEPVSILNSNVEE